MKQVLRPWRMDEDAHSYLLGWQEPGTHGFLFLLYALTCLDLLRQAAPLVRGRVML